jgi:hypothetical protein
LVSSRSNSLTITLLTSFSPTYQNQSSKCISPTPPSWPPSWPCPSQRPSQAPSPAPATSPTHPTSPSAPTTSPPSARKLAKPMAGSRPSSASVAKPKSSASGPVLLESRPRLHGEFLCHSIRFGPYLWTAARVFVSFHDLFLVCFSDCESVDIAIAVGKILDSCTHDTGPPMGVRSAGQTDAEHNGNIRVHAVLKT